MESGGKMRGQAVLGWMFVCVSILLVAVVLALHWRVDNGGHRASPTEGVREVGGEDVEGSGGEFPRSLVTSDGEVVIPTWPHRIVSQTLFTDEVLLAICAPDRIAGIHAFALSPQYSNCIPDATKIADRVVEGAEAIVALAPDLVFVSSHSRAEIVDQLRTASGCAIVRFSRFESLEDIRRNIIDVGYTIGEEKAARELVREMDERIAAAVARIPPASESPGVVSYGTSSSTAGEGTLFDDIVRTIRARNLAAEHGVKWFGQVGVEQIGSWDPDAIVCGAGPEAIESTRKQMLENPVFAATKAGRNGRAIVLENRVFLAASHHVAGFVEALVDELYFESQPVSIQ
jgi:iron complex transport system substrate-binding protein